MADIQPESIELNEMFWMSPPGIDGVMVSVRAQEEGHPPAVLQGEYYFALYRYRYEAINAKRSKNVQINGGN